MRRALIAIALSLALVVPARAVTMSEKMSDKMSGLYDQQTLAYWKAKYEISTQKTLDKIVPVLLGEEERAIGDVHLDIPIYPAPEQAEAPFAFYSYSGSQGPVVVFPAVSLKFLDDLCTAYAWLQIHGYSLEPISDYVAMLKYQDFPRGATPKPLPTLGVPADALNEKKVDDLALSHFVTARAFILAHELGHLRYHHRGSSIPHERQADAFAAEVMERIPLPMLGALVFFMADAHFANYPPRPDATHPTSAERLHALAARISDREIAAGVESIAKSLDEPDVASAVAAVGLAASPATLGPQRPHALPTLATLETAKSGEAFNGTFVGVFTQKTDPGNPGPISAVLNRQGAQVNGVYTFGLGTGKITSGTVNGDALFFEWEWAGNYGRGTLHLTPDGNGFNGTWGYRESTDNAGTWTGQRIRAP